MAITLQSSHYGKGAVRVKKLIKHSNYHEIKDLAVETRCYGDFTAAHMEGDNRLVLPTDTQKNIIYILAKSHPLDSIESFGLELASRLFDEIDHFSKVIINIEQALWTSLPTKNGGHPYAFQKAGPQKWTTCIQKDANGFQIQSGIKALGILKSTHSGFSNFLTGAYTTLKDTDDRMLETSLDARWTYQNPQTDFEKLRHSIQSVLCGVFAGHQSLSVQHTLYAMGEAVLSAVPEVSKIELSMPNKHNLLFDFSPFRMDNDNVVFVATDEPYGIINGTVSRMK